MMKLFSRIFIVSGIILISATFVSLAVPSNALAVVTSQVTFSNSQIYYDANSKVSSISCSSVPGAPSYGTCDGGYYPDNATAQKLCQMKGYDTLVSWTPQSNFFSSCSDNFMWQWNGSGANYVWACTQDTGIDTVTCGKNVNITCSTNAQCGTSGLTGSPFCQGNAVYQAYKTYTCNNPGTASSSCSNSTNNQLQINCTGNQTCTSGQCVNQNIACSSNSDCGTSGFINGLFCQNGNVYQAYKTYTCSNPGTPSSKCTNADDNRLQTTCTTNQTCSNGQCNNLSIACSSNSDCGANTYTDLPFCQGNSIWQNYLTYTCSNPGTPSSSCSHNTASQQKNSCSANQTCSNGNCVNNLNDLSVTCSTTPNPSQVSQQVSFISSAVGGDGTYTYAWTGDCTGSSSYICHNTFSEVGTKTATVSVTSAGKSTSATCSVNVAQSCSSNASQRCVGNTIYWFDSCGVQGGLVRACVGNQVCSDGNCVNQTIRCSSDSDCGINAYSDSPYCGTNNSIWQNFKTFTCKNPGTASSSCVNSTASQLKNTCTTNQTCSGGSCVVNQPIACSHDSDCGASAISGSPYCGTNNSVYQNYTNPTCLNPGTASSSCTNPVTPHLVNTCTANQTCANNTCTNINIACTSDSDCSSQNGFTGNPTCNGNSIYQNYRTYICQNPNTASSRCISTDANQKKNDCTSGQTCSNGSCTNQTITCSSDSICGTNAYTGSPFCQGNSVWQNYITYTCNNPGTVSSSCSHDTIAQLKNSCTGNQNCSNGTCGSNCSTHSYQQCNGNYLYWYDSCGNQQDSQYCPSGCSGNICQQQQQNNISVQTNGATNNYNNQATLNGYVYTNNYNNSYNYNNNYSNTYVWFQWGITTSYGAETNHQSMNYSGPFSQMVNLYSYNTTYHYRAVAQNGNGQIVYGQDMVIYGNQQPIGGTLNAVKTVRNLTSSSGFASSTYASPSDQLMFMITLQNTGNQDMQNVVVTDYLPANLTYANQLTVACSTSNGNYSNNYNNCSGSNYNYTGNISSGVYLNTIYAGQTVTITYQAQVAGAQNFAYGSTTLTNNATVTSSTGTIPAANASVIVTRSAVYGASTVSTGLTNNFWVDSFLLPLLITLICIWIWKSGMLVGAEKWLDNQKKKTRAYKAEKELNSRISKIRKLEGI